LDTLPILYQDDQFIAINKPSGLLVHRSEIDRHETQFAVQLLRDQIGQRVYPIHRLDKPTSGILLFALNTAMARAVADQFQQHTVVKTYLAVVRGHPPKEGVIDHPLTLRPDTPRERRKIQRAGLQAVAQEAITSYQTLATVEIPFAVDKYPNSRYALVKLQPQTGRKHQLRRHMKHISHPIIGDPKFGKSKHNHFFADHYQCSRLLLAACQLVFVHPITGLPVTVTAPLTGCFRQLLCHFNWQSPF